MLMGDVDATCGLEAQLAGLVSLQREQTQVLLTAIRKKFLIASDPRILTQEVDAGGAAPAVAGRLDEVGASLAAVRVETSADHSIGLELRVVVFRDFAAEFDQLEKAA